VKSIAKVGTLFDQRDAGDFSPLQQSEIVVALAAA
jgi:hypothetical protein